MSYESKPIVAWFVPRIVPYGGAPEAIKQGWVGVPLPVRYERPPEGPEANMGHNVNDVFDITIFEDSVTIGSVDALKSLRIFEKEDAMKWWEDYFGGRHAELVFAVEKEDQVYPDSLMRIILPGIETFDDIA